MLLNISSNSETRLRGKQENSSGFFDQIKGENSRKESSSNIATSMGYGKNLQHLTLLSRMELLRGKVEHWWSVLAVC